MRSWPRVLRANLLYLRRPFRQFLPVLLGMVAILLGGAFAFHHLYVGPGGERLSWSQALYITYCLIFMEHVIEALPEPTLLRVFYFVLPPLGLVVILDGIIRFSYHILRRDETSGEWVRAMSHTMHNHVVLFGLGKLGLRILQQLLHLGELVIVVERNPQCEHLGYARKEGVPLLIGNGREPDIFEKTNLADAKSVILATDDDLANLEIALDARKIKADIRVVLRMFDQELAAKIKDAFDLQLAFSTTELAAPVFATASSDESIVNSFKVGDQLIVVAQLRVAPGSGLEGRTVGEVRDAHQTFVLEHRRGKAVRPTPTSDLALAAGDDLIVQADTAHLRALQRLNGEAKAR